MSKTARIYEKNNRYVKNQIKIKKTGSGIKRFLLAMFIVAAVLTVFLYFTNKYFFVIENINIIINENEKYSGDEIMEALRANGVVSGAELYGIDADKIKENIKENFTYIESIDISRIPPSTVNIDIKTEQGLFGIFFGGDYYIISENFKVAEKIKIVGSKTPETEFKPPENIITLETYDIKKCYIGNKIEFFDADIIDFLKEIAKLHENNKDAFSRIISIDVTNKFKVAMNYENKFLVNFGIFENISSKIFNSFEIIENLPNYAEGIIDMTESKAASFTYDENISKLYKSGARKNG